MLTALAAWPLLAAVTALAVGRGIRLSGTDATSPPPPAKTVDDLSDAVIDMEFIAITAGDTVLVRAHDGTAP